MKHILITVMLALVGLVASAGSPYVVAETGVGVNSESEVMWNVNAVAGYAIPFYGVVWSPELMVGHSLIREDKRMLGGTEKEFRVSSNFHTAFRMNLNFRLYKKLWFYTAPNVHYTVGGYRNFNHHWGLSWLAGFKYQWKNYFFRISYNQKITPTFSKHINPITLGVEYHF